VDDARRDLAQGGLPDVARDDEAVRYERLLVLERERRRRTEQLEPLLSTIADALDIREIFPRLSDVIQPVIPHVTVSLALLTPDGQGVKIHVASNYDVGELPVYRFTSEQEAISAGWRSFIGYDCTVLEEGVTRILTSPPGVEPPTFVDLRPGPPWTTILSRLGIRSLLRVPVRVKGRAVGGISFGADKPAAYGGDDVTLATRIADHIALALAHEELAEARHRAARAQAEAESLQERINTLVQEIERRGEHRALGESEPWTHALTQAAKVAATDTTVLITGESGTGKEVVARFIHRGSRRARGAFVALNCAALPEQLLEAELFGVERGAFTGAVTSRAGMIEQANGGVLFLDEVGEMTPAVQAKFLRVLQEREFQRLGGGRTIKADIRVIAATNRNPRDAVARGQLREDLYYRLSVFEVALPPLRDRPGDILLLAEAFLTECANTVGRPAAGLSEDARDRLVRHAWPGNVRELRNAIERAVILCEGGLVTGEHLPITVTAAKPAPAVAVTALASADALKLSVVERDVIEKALASARNNKSKAAKLLGVPRGQFYSLLRKHGLTDARR
jgi:transcriptional regulator with GAF, ATPase, and Fis domain